MNDIWTPGNGWPFGSKSISTTRPGTSSTAMHLNTWIGALPTRSALGKWSGRNTAILELKTMAMILGEAVRLGHAEANPLVSLKLRRDKAAKKPELTDAEIIAIREALRTEPNWMQTVFDIALHTGCRLRERKIPLSCVDFQENKITFPCPKGGEERAFSIPMPSALNPLFENLRTRK